MRMLLDPLPASVVLDAACGTGRYSQYLAERGHRVIGVDRSVAMLAKARENLPQCAFREGDLEALPLEAASVDTVVCALALVHLPEVGRAIAELARVVRPGGRVIISDVHPFLVLLGWQAQFRTAVGGTGFMRLHPHLPSGYCEAFAAAGLRVRPCHEPRLTPESAVTVAAERLPEANRAAWVGLPGVVIWDLEKPCSGLSARPRTRLGRAAAVPIFQEPKAGPAVLDRAPGSSVDRWPKASRRTGSASRGRMAASTSATR